MQDLRYKAFISYSHADKKTAAWLFRRIETFRTPRQLIGTPGQWGPAAARLTPIFRDREELSTSHALGEKLMDALLASEFLIVLCSPASARSRWVNEEIKAFRAHHGSAKVLAIIAEGEPGAPVGEGLEGCFPPALLAPDTEGGKPQEPIAADLRGDGDGDRLAFLKLAAGLLGVGLDDLVHREARRRQKFLAGIAATASTLTFAFAVLALFAVQQRIEADKQRVIAESERDTATSALDYLVSIFKEAQPEKEVNPKDITALEILDRGRKNIDASFRNKPAVRAKLLVSMGDIYSHLSQRKEALETLRAAIDSPSVSLPDKLHAQLTLADILTKDVALDEATAVLDAVERELKLAAGAKPSVGAMDQLFGRLAERRGDIAWYKANDLDAAAFYAEAKTRFTAAGDELYVARAASSRGLALSRAGQFDEAEADLREAIALQNKLNGPNHIETAIAFHNLAYMQFERGDYDGAAKNLETALKVYRKVLDRTHRTFSVASLLYARILEARGDLPEAVSAHLESVELAKSAFGPTNENVGWRLVFLAAAQAKAGQAEEGLKTLDEAQVIYDARFPAGDFNHGDILVYRAMVLDKAGRRDEAKRNCAEGVRILAANSKPDDVYLKEMSGHCAKLSG